MDDSKFFTSFHFRELRFDRYHHTDNSLGVDRHFFGYLKQGTCLLVSGKERITVSEGELFYLPKGLKYHSYWSSESTVVFDSFGFKYLPVKQRYKMQKIRLTETAAVLLSQLSQNKSTGAESVGLLYLLFHEVSKQMQPDALHYMDKTVQTAMEYMVQRPAYTMTDIARLMEISESKLYYDFKHALGKTPNTVKQEISCEKAVELLSTTDLSVEEISFRSGFCSSSYFRKVLFSFTGKTPRQIRNEAKNI